MAESGGKLKTCILVLGNAMREAIDFSSSAHGDPNHACSKAKCNPRNESDLIRAGVIHKVYPPGSVRTGFFYLCDYTRLRMLDANEGAVKRAEHGAVWLKDGVDVNKLIRKGLIRKALEMRDIYICSAGAVHVCMAGHCFMGKAVCPISSMRKKSTTSAYVRNGPLMQSMASRNRRYTTDQTKRFRQAGSSASFWLALDGASRIVINNRNGQCVGAAPGGGGKNNNNNNSGVATAMRVSKNKRKIDWLAVEGQRAPGGDGDDAGNRNEKGGRGDGGVRSSGSGGSSSKRSRVEISAHGKRKVRRVIQRIVESLLYSKRREKINAKKQTAQTRKLAKMVVKRTSRDARQGKFTDMSAVYCDSVHMVLRTRPYLRILKRDEDRLSYYVDIVFHVWRIIHEYGRSGGNAGEKLAVQATMATLYAMRSGDYIKMGKKLLPGDAYLCNLPELNELHLFVEENERRSLKKSYTQGMKSMEGAFCSAIERGVHPSRYMFDTGRLKSGKIVIGGVEQQMEVECVALGGGD